MNLSLCVIHLNLYTYIIILDRYHQHHQFPNMVHDPYSVIFMCILTLLVVIPCSLLAE